MKIIKLVMIIVAPAGQSRYSEALIPIKTASKATAMELIIALLKLLEICRAAEAGIINSAETSMIPTTLIAKTTVMPVKVIKIKFKRFVLMPEALA